MEHVRYFADTNGKLIFHISSENIQEDLAFITLHEVKSINLNPRMGYEFSDIKCVVESIPFVEELWVSENIKLDGIENLSNLKLLKINTAQKVDFSKLPNLEDLDFKFDKKMLGFECLTKLKSLSVEKGDSLLFSIENFENSKLLERMVVVQSKIFDFSFLGIKKEFKILEVYYCRSEIDFANLGVFMPNVETIKISNCKGNKNISKTGLLNSLGHFALVDSGSVENCLFVNNMTNLRNLIVLGKSYFLDGDLSLLEKKNLEHCAFDNKKHYTHKSTYSNEKLRSFISKR